MVEWVPQMAATSISVPRGASVASCLSGGPPRSVEGSDPGTFQINTSVLGVGVCEVLHVPFKSGVCFLQPSGSPILKPHWSSKQDILGASLPNAGPPGWVVWCGAWTPCSLCRNSAIVIILPFVGCLPGGVGLAYTVSLPLLSVSLWFLLYIFSGRKSFLLVFKWFS